jgi:hypothetical protein
MIRFFIKLFQISPQKNSIENLNNDPFNTSLTTWSQPSSRLDEMRAQSRLKAIKFLLLYLRLPAPNIAHVLLGFDIHKPLKNQTFFNPGTKINYANASAESAEILSIVPRTCLHSIINILTKYVKEPAGMFHRMSSTIDACYELLFILCSNFQFNQQLLHYLRSEFDFVNANLRKIPFKLDAWMPLNESNFAIGNFFQFF